MHDTSNRSLLQQIAHRAMLEKGLAPEFSSNALNELAALREESAEDLLKTPGVRDLRELLWCSIDNDDSLDLDQLTVAIPETADATRILVAIADVDAVVHKGMALDEHAQRNTTTVYTAAQIFPMLPEKISTDLTSLKHESERLAVIIDLGFAVDGSIHSADIYVALVYNYARLAYNSVAEWMNGRGTIPARLAAVPGLDENIRLQWHVAQQLKTLRLQHGALDFETTQARPVFAGEELRELRADAPNNAKELIAEFMIAANSATARFLSSKKYPSIRRVVRTPKRWDRIVELAAERGTVLPQTPDSVALERFLAASRESDPRNFSDLSMSVIKLLGRGEYILLRSGEEPEGHFGLATKDYAHSTAPNRRFPDVITQRLLKAAIAGIASPYSEDELASLAAHCTASEDAAKKVERQVEKSAAALLLEHRVGEYFNAIVTGASPKATWVRIYNPPVEGRLHTRGARVDVGQKLRVRLVDTNVQKGFLDFEVS